MPTENHTKFKFDTKLATAKLVNGLIRNAANRFDVIDPETWATLAEAAKKAAKEVPAEGEEPAMVTAAPEGELLMLHSEVRSTSTAADGREAVLVLVTYRLVESGSAKALWAWSTEWTRARGDEGYETVNVPKPSPTPKEEPLDSGRRPAAEEPSESTEAEGDGVTGVPAVPATDDDPEP